MKTVLTLIVISFTVLTNGCSSAKKQDSVQKPRKITLNAVEKLEIGKTNMEVFRQLFGEPVKKVSHGSSEEIWSYQDFNGEFNQQRLNVLFDRETKILATVTFVLNPDEELTKLDAVKTYFSNADFKTEKTSKAYGHYTVERTYYVDKDLGISLSSWDGKGDVSAISWSKSPKRSNAGK